MAVHSDERPYKCPECGQQFKLESQVKRHHKLRHSCEPAYVCRIDDCHQEFESRKRLMKHKESEHNIEYKKNRKKNVHECDWPACGYRSRNGYNLEEHKRVHTGEKPFVCTWNQCDKRFRTRTGLIDHDNIHKNIKRYACDWPGCQYRCTFGGNLNKHMRVHQKN